jgi:endonuclease/exonuclease/phosphatase family metal-dependent hydrolase
MRRDVLAIFLLLFMVVDPASSIAGDNSGTPVKKRRLTILSYNVRNCRGLDNVTDYQRVADVINRINPSVVALQELDSATQRSNGVVVLDELARRTKMYPVYGASIGFQGGKYGVGILTRERPLGWWLVPLPGREESRSLLFVELKDVIFCCTHFSLNEHDRMASVDIINNLFNDTGKPVILAGDLNATPDSEVIRRLEEKWTMLNNPAVPTFPADNPVRCIDYIFVLKGGTTNVLSGGARVEQEPVASDHLPVWVRVKTRFSK